MLRIANTDGGFFFYRSSSSRYGRSENPASARNWPLLSPAKSDVAQKGKWSSFVPLLNVCLYVGVPYMLRILRLVCLGI